MFHPANSGETDFVEVLASRGNPAAVAARFLNEGKYSKAVEICRVYLEENPDSLSGRLILARALYHAGQTESAEKQFYRVLSADPDNLVALKYLGDIKFAGGDEHGALANYRRVLEIDSYCRALCCAITVSPGETTRTITIRRPQETPVAINLRQALKEIPFYTETMGDLYLAQGYPGLAADVFRSLSETTQNPRIAQKLIQAEEKIKQKESSHVKKTD